MKKKKNWICFLLLFLLFAAFFIKSEKTLWGLLHISEEDIWKCSVQELSANGTQWKEESHAPDAAEIEEILDRLKKIRVFFQGWSRSADLPEGEAAYDLLLFDDSKHWLRFYENGMVDILCWGHWRFAMDAADAEDWRTR